MKNVLLLGDSIRMGYDKSVKGTLEGCAKVYFPTENCRFAAYLLRNLHEYKGLVGEERVDVLHWNTGLWDCARLFGEEPQTPIEIYEYYMERICIRMQKLFPEAQVIFATSTRVLSERMTQDFKRYNEEIEEYNEAAVKVVLRHGFQVNDLYGVSAALPEEAHSDAVHYYTAMGTRCFTNQVISCLLPTLGLDANSGKDLEYKESMYTDAPIGM